VWRSLRHFSAAAKRSPRALPRWKQHWQHRRPNAVALCGARSRALLNFFAVPASPLVKVQHAPT